MKAYTVAFLLLAAGVVAVSLFLVGCEGPEGPQGPAGPPGPGVSGETTYLGDNANNCGHCHGTVTGEWLGTKHSQAWDALTMFGDRTHNNYCVQCHTTGFDDVWADSTTRTSQGVNNGGYDDNPRAEMRGVQCEQCHGPMGPNPATHEPELATALSGAKCSRCHEAFDDVAESGHGTAIERAGGFDTWLAEFGGSTCQKCHVSEGFIMFKEGITGLELANGVICATCHDPHDGTGASQLRVTALGAAFSDFGGMNADSMGYNITGWNKGQVCAQCHHARRTLANIRDQIDANGSRRLGPHESPQADMLGGKGCWEVPGPDTARTSKHQPTNTVDMCVTCHFDDREHGDPIHTFEPSLASCQGCHPGLNSFDRNGVQTDIDQLLDQLGNLLPPAGPEVMDSTNTSEWTSPLREAAYIYKFVVNDGSHGVHNYQYARTLLRNAIDHVTLNAVAAGKSEKSAQ